jgi:Bifunctional DNA primase/polymerase, N-terminal
MHNNDTLDKALALAKRGLPVFFCSRTKRPTLIGGFHNASTDPTRIKELYETAPGPLIGVPTGIKFCVVDPDLQHKPARDWWKANKDRLPITRRHRTASGGWHILFKPHPGFRTGVTVAQNVDTRADGGYIIWWPAEGYQIVNPNLLTEVPAWILEAIPPEREGIERASGLINRSPLDTYLAGCSSPEAALAGILHTMARARNGERQCICFWSANRIGEMVAAGLLTAEAFDALGDVAVDAGLAAHRVADVLRRVQRTVL